MKARDNGTDMICGAEPAARWRGYMGNGLSIVKIKSKMTPFSKVSWATLGPDTNKQKTLDPC